MRGQVRTQADDGAALAEQVGAACAGLRLQFVDRGGQQVGRAGRYVTAVQPADRELAAITVDPDLVGRVADLDEGDSALRRRQRLDQCRECG